MHEPDDPTQLQWLWDMASSPAKNREAFAKWSFTERVIFREQGMALQHVAILYTGDRNPDKVVIHPDGIPLPDDYLDAFSDGPFIAQGLPGHRIARRIAGQLHAAAIAEVGYMVSPMEEVASEDTVERDENVFIAIESGRAVGFATSLLYSELVLVSRADEHGFVKKDCRFRPLQDDERVRGVELVWVCANCRRRGIAQQLLRSIAEAHGVEGRGLVFRLPFSRAGLRQVRRLAGDRFVCVGHFPVLGCPLDQLHKLYAPDRITEGKG